MTDATNDREFMPEVSDDLPPGERPMVAIVRAAPGHEPQLSEAIATLTAAVRQEPGCREFRPFQDAASARCGAASVPTPPPHGDHGFSR